MCYSELIDVISLYMTKKNNSLKLWQNTEFCEIENYATVQRANEPVKPTLSLE